MQFNPKIIFDESVEEDTNYFAYNVTAQWHGGKTNIILSSGISEKDTDRIISYSMTPMQAFSLAALLVKAVFSCKNFKSW